MEYTKYEIARMLGSRALQISQGAPFLVKISDKELEEIKYSPLEIAKREFAAGVLPITVKRPYPLPGQKKR
ncbi:DNA-directed RNA polymerase subunit K [Candidatus Woesearchaeota archaeon]|nr:DNA-directed RNA polymerase subunit K [Candidatus Woesearchaeota archaeon]